MATIYLLNKPYQVLCQFRDNENRPTLANYITIPNVYAAGRLDYDSEGLLLLTGDGQLQHSITQPQLKQPKSYWVQVEGQITDDALNKLRHGVTLKDGPTLPAKAVEIAEPPVWPRHPPIRERANIPTSWINLTITEGRNRQVRRMTAAVGFPTLRLIRHQIADWTLDTLEPGQWRQEQAATPPPNRPASKQGRAKPPRSVRKPKYKANKGHPK